MKQRVSALVLAITCFALGAVFQRYYDAYRLVTQQSARMVKSPPVPDSGTADLVVANLTEEDLVAIAAYVSSRLPPGAGAPVKQVATVAQQ